MKNKHILICVICILLLLGSLLFIKTSLKKDKPIVKVEDIKAIYLCSENSRMLSDSKLKDYPQIKTVMHFKDVIETADNKLVSIWVDKNSVDLVNREWLREKAKRGYPIALVGYGDEIYCFKELLPVYDIRLNLDFSKRSIISGYSIGLYYRTTESSSRLFIRGYNKEVDAGDLLALTNKLMEDKIPE